MSDKTKAKLQFIWRPKNRAVFEQVKLLAEFIEHKSVTDLIDDWAAAAVALNADKLQRMMKLHDQIVEIAAEPDDKPAATPPQNFSVQADVIRSITDKIPVQVSLSGDLPRSTDFLKQTWARMNQQPASELDEQTGADDGDETSPQPEPKTAEGGEGDE